MSKFDEMCEMKETLIKWAKSEIERGPENVNTEEMLLHLVIRTSESPSFSIYFISGL